jgi:DNA polymerase-1
MKTLLIDGQWNLKRNFFKRKDLKGANHKLCGGTFGFLESTKIAINKIMPDRVIVAWDGFHAGKLRYNVYKPYKANREKDWESETRMIATDGIGNPDDSEKFEILSQKIEVQKYLEELFIRQLEEDYIEADDLIAGCILLSENPDEEFYIFSRDGDFMQLISDRVSIINPDSLDTITKDNFKEKFGYTHENALLLKCFKGDDSDGIPGINGIGIATLLKHFPDMASEVYTYKRLVEECYEKKKKKNLKTYDKIIGAEHELYRNAMLMNLKRPFLNREAIKSIKETLNLPLDSNRSVEVAMQKFVKDGFNQFIGNQYMDNFFGPFYRIKAKEKEFENSLNKM